MRQLTSLDTQFIAAEDERTHLNVSALSIRDPSTTADGKLTLDELTSVFASRLPSCRRALTARRGTAEARLPVLVRRSRLRSRVSRPRAAAARARRSWATRRA